MSTSPENPNENLQPPSEELPSVDQLLATIPLEHFLYGIHMSLDGGVEECLVDPGLLPSRSDDVPEEDQAD